MPDDRPFTRVDDVVRWEGNNIDKIIAFMVDIAFMRPELSLENIEEM